MSEEIVVENLAMALFCNGLPVAATKMRRMAAEIKALQEALEGAKEDAAAAYQEGRKEGYDAGWTDGYRDGWTDGYEAGRDILSM